MKTEHYFQQLDRETQGCVPTSTITEETNLFKQAAETLKTLHAENAALREENRRLRKHVLDLYSDLETASRSEPDDLTPAQRLGGR